MIFKRIAARSKRTSEPNRINRLIRYIATPEKFASPDADGFEAKVEKCTYFKAVNFFCDPTDISAICQEITDLAEQKHPNASGVINHYILSWGKHHHPSNMDIDHSVKTLMAKFEVLECQYIYGRHDDTENIHVHIVVNRVNPITNQTHRINGGFDIKAGHQARELIERQLGLEPLKKFTEPAYTPIELDTGFESRDRTISRLIIPILDSSRSWAYFHLQLNEQGMALFRSGHGFAISLGHYRVRASKIDERLSRNNLERKLGEFVPSLTAKNTSVNLNDIPIQLIVTDKLRMTVFSIYMDFYAKYLVLKAKLSHAIKSDYNREIHNYKVQMEVKLKTISDAELLDGEQIVAELHKQLEIYKLARQQHWQDIAKQCPPAERATFKNWCRDNNIDHKQFYQLTATKNLDEQRIKIRINRNLGTPLDQLTDELSQFPTKHQISHL